VVALYTPAFPSRSGPAAPTQPTTPATTTNGLGGAVIVTGGTGACTPVNVAANYWDIGVRGDTTPTDHTTTHVTLAPQYSVLTSTAGYTTLGPLTLHNVSDNPRLLSEYCNGSRPPPEFQSLGYQVPPGVADATVPNPVFNLTPAATVDEGNNWVNISWGPLALTNVVNNVTLFNFNPASDSSVINLVPSNASTYSDVLGGGGANPFNGRDLISLDYYGNPRKTNNNIDAGAVEFVPPPVVAANVSGGPLSFGNVPVTTTSATQNLTLHNTGNVQLTGITISVTGPFVQVNSGGFPGGAPNCTATLAAGSNCTIKVAFQPTAVGAANGTVAITSNAVVAGSPVGLSGTGLAAVIAATLTPTSWTPTGTRGCTTGIAGIGGTCPGQTFLLTNTGNVPLTGIVQGAVTGANVIDFPVTRLTSTCGPGGGGQALGLTSLNPGSTCQVVVRFAPGAGEVLNSTDTATLTVNYSGGSKSSSLSGTVH